MRKRNSSAILALAALCLVGCGNAPSSGPAGGDATWTVTFDSQGGSAIATQKVKHGEKAAKPADPTRDGYAFAGWYKDEAAITPFDFNLAITADWTIFAGWNASITPSSSDSSTPTGAKIYKATGLPTWLKNDGCVIFAWAWGGEDAGNGKWFSLTFEDATNATFSVTADLTGFLLARCAAGTTTPDWNIKSGDVPGRVYNQTNNVTCSPGTYEYACPENQWKGYPGK